MPLAALTVPSGKHRVVVGQDGYQIFVEDVSVGRGDTSDINVDLAMTPQRIASWVLFAGSVAAAGTGVGLAIAAASRQSNARKISDRSENQQRPLTVDEMTEYNTDLSTRDNLRRLAGIALGVGLLAAGSGLLLYGPALIWLSVFDFSWPADGELFSAAMYPFIPGDLVKLMMAALAVGAGWKYVDYRRGGTRV